jgi:hypothetical protein
MMKNPEKYDFIDEADKKAARNGMEMILQIKDYFLEILPKEVIWKIDEYSDSLGRLLEVNLLEAFSQNIQIPFISDFGKNIEEGKYSFTKRSNLKAPLLVKILNLLYQSEDQNSNFELSQGLVRGGISQHPEFNLIAEKVPKLKQFLLKNPSIKIQKEQNRLLGNNSFRIADEFQEIIHSANGIDQKSASAPKYVGVEIIEPKEGEQEQCFKIQILNRGILNQEHLIEERPVLHCLSEFVRENTPYDDSRKRPRIERGEETKRLKPDTSKPQESPRTQIPNEIILSKSNFEKLLHKLQKAEEEEVKLNLGNKKGR